MYVLQIPKDLSEEITTLLIGYVKKAIEGFSQVVILPETCSLAFNESEISNELKVEII